MRSPVFSRIPGRDTDHTDTVLTPSSFDHGAREAIERGFGSGVNSFGLLSLPVHYSEETFTITPSMLCWTICRAKKEPTLRHQKKNAFLVDIDHFFECSFVEFILPGRRFLIDQADVGN